MLLAGFVYAWSILSAPIAEEFPSWTSAQLSLTFTLCIAFFCLGGVAGGMLQGRMPARFIVRAASVLFLAGFFLASRTRGPWVLYLGYGILCGTASGFAYNAVMNTVPKWFPKNQGLISGILLMGFGASSMIIGTAFTALTPETAGAWRSSLLFMGALMAVVLAAGSFFIRAPEKVATGSASAPEAQAKPGFSPGQMLRQPGFWRFFAWSTLLSGSGLIVIAQARSLAIVVGPRLSAGTLSFTVGLISVCNGLGRILIGAMFDRFNHKIAMRAVVLLYLVGATLITLSFFSGSYPLLAAGFVALGFGYGGGPTTSAALTRIFYGSNHYAVNFSIANLNLMVASLSSTAEGALYDATGSFLSVFVLLFFCILAAMIVMPGIRKPDIPA